MPPVLLEAYVVDFVSQKHFWMDKTKPFTCNQTCFSGPGWSACLSAHQAGNTKASKCNKRKVLEPSYLVRLRPKYDAIHEAETLQHQLKTVVQLCQ